MANDSFGSIVTEQGAGFTWADNSRENKLTPWYNDPIAPPLGEIIYMIDNETGELWSVTLNLLGMKMSTSYPMDWLYGVLSQ